MSRQAEDLGFPAWANAFAHLIVYAAGVLVCYLLVAFIRFELDPTAWGVFPRLAFVATGLVWTGYFIDAATDDGDEE